MSLSRRTLLRSTFGLIGAAVLSVPVGVGYALKVEPRWLQVTRKRVTLARWPVGAPPLRLVHVTDLHAGTYSPSEFLQRVVDTVNQLDADVIALTGDYIYLDDMAIRWCAPLLGQLRARLGVYGVTGNHDIWSASAGIWPRLVAAGITMLDGEAISVPWGEGTVWIVGVGDRGLTAAWGSDGSDFRRAWREGLAGLQTVTDSLPPDQPRILLVHNPDVTEMLQPGQVDLALCGHTHGGQVQLPLLGAPAVPSLYGQRYTEGLVQGPATLVHVSRGIGVTVLPVRFGSRPEVSLLQIGGPGA